MMVDDDLYSEFVLARELGGMTVEEMRARMSHREYLGWHSFYKRRAIEAEQAAEIARSKKRRR